jgi:zinc protease
MFGPIAAGEATAPVIRQEPDQRGERKVVVNGPGDTSYLTLSYRAPAAANSDYYPMVLLNAAFAGGSSLGVFGGGGTNKSSRLYQALVSTELAVAAFGGLAPTVDPYLYSLSAVVRNDRTLAEVQEALEVALEQLASKPISQTELKKALKRAKAQFAMAGESITGQTQLLGMAEAVVGDYRWFETVLDNLNKVTLEDIERVRQRYLRPQNRVVGWYEPSGNGVGA